MELSLVDLNPALTDAWSSEFTDYPEVNVIEGSILSIHATAIVSPANSHGFMDGGIDALYLRHFGHGIQERVRDMIYRKPGEMLPVGAAEFVYTDHADIPILIVAPTMEFPEAVPALNARRAFRAVLRLLSRHDWIDAVSCPGMCTGIGQVPVQEAAHEMAVAYADWKSSGE